MTAHGTNRPHLNRIQNRRNGSHVILAQQQPKKPEELLVLPAGVPQDIVHLLQSRNQDLPELAENLCFPVFSLGIQFFGHGL